jgi:hypothetical protein
MSLELNKRKINFYLSVVIFEVFETFQQSFKTDEAVIYLESKFRLFCCTLSKGFWA